jgi:hypothetical protein
LGKERNGNGVGVWGIVNETEKRHMKVKVFLSISSSSLGSASGTGTYDKEKERTFVVENNGYRLDELKSGRVEVRLYLASFTLLWFLTIFGA